MELFSTNFFTFKFRHVKEEEIMSESYQDGLRLSYLKSTLSSSSDVVYASDVIQRIFALTEKKSFNENRLKVFEF